MLVLIVTVNMDFLKSVAGMMVDVLGKIAVMLGLVLNIGTWVTELPINAWVATGTGILGMAYLIWKIYNANLDSQIKKQTLKQLKNDSA